MQVIKDSRKSLRFKSCVQPVPEAEAPLMFIANIPSVPLVSILERGIKVCKKSIQIKLNVFSHT